MHIGAWQELKLYKILVLRDNYKKNGLYQLSNQQENQNNVIINNPSEKSSGQKSPSVSSTGKGKETASFSVKTTVSNQNRKMRGKPAIRNHSNATSGSRASYNGDKGSFDNRSVRSKSSKNPTQILKENYQQWAQYQAAKDFVSKKAAKMYF